MHPTQLYQLEARGTLPERPGRGIVTPEYIRALADHRQLSGEIPEAARDLLDEVKA